MELFACVKEKKNKQTNKQMNIIPFKTKLMDEIQLEQRDLICLQPLDCWHSPHSTLWSVLFCWVYTVAMMLMAMLISHGSQTKHPHIAHHLTPSKQPIVVHQIRNLKIYHNGKFITFLFSGLIKGDLQNKAKQSSSKTILTSAK